MSILTLSSGSAATDAAWRAAADISEIATELGVKYRLVGGISVTLLTHHYEVDDQVPSRETADADMGAPHDVCSDERLIPAMVERGYSLDGGNRFVRADENDPRTIDILGPAHSDLIQSNTPAGDLSIDLIPGLHSALQLDPVEVDVRALLRDGSTLELSLTLPGLHGALVMKSLAYRGRYQQRDAVDIWRLLVTAHALGFDRDDWPEGIEPRKAAHYLHQFFASPAGRGPRSATSSKSEQARIRLLVPQIVPEPRFWSSAE